MSDKITVPDLTGGEVEGGGVFDELMRSVKSHLDMEYREGRITGDKYANIYVSVLTQVLQTASQYAIEAPLTSQRVLLLQEEITQAERQTDLINAQIAKLQAETDVSVKQLDIMTQQILDMQASTALTIAKTLESEENLNVLREQVTLTSNQAALAVSNATLTDQKILSEVQQTEIAVKQVKLTENQGLLAEQKIVTEKAQTTNEGFGADFQIITNPNGTTTVTGGGILGSSVGMQYKQKDGFDRDAELKSANVMTSNWNVRQTTTSTESSSEAGMSNAEIKKVVDKLKEGIGVVPGTDTGTS